MFSCLSNFAATLAEASGIVTCIKPAALRICRRSFAMLIMWEAAGGLEHPVVVVRVTMFRLTPRMACGGAIRGCRCSGWGLVRAALNISTLGFHQLSHRISLLAHLGYSYLLPSLLID